MTVQAARSGSTPLLNALLGALLVLVAVVDIVVLGGIGWAAWQRATLSEHRNRMRREDPFAMADAQREAHQLQALISTSRESISGTLQAFPGDSELAHYLASLPAQATEMGVAITELSPRPSLPSAIPVRRFVLRARGPWTSMVRFCAHVAQNTLPTERIEEVTLRREGDQGNLTCELLVATHPAYAPQASNPRDTTALTLMEGQRHQE